RWNGPLDLARLAEEVEDLGSERRDAVLSQLRRIMEHLLKLEYSAHDRPRLGWRRSVVSARSEIELRLTPTIRLAAADVLPRLYRQARAGAALALAEHGEADAARGLPETCPWSLDQLLDETWLPANRHGLEDEI
ncbi:MAG TPA: DUF29 domain-containing protein, partial [Geminicoccaceae bacterium]|nr:DUF29 domain-containing protein [Geminicoccaceae bacterium]